MKVRSRREAGGGWIWDRSEREAAKIIWIKAKEKRRRIDLG
jgi:hypothetical protein